MPDEKKPEAAAVDEHHSSGSEGEAEEVDPQAAEGGEKKKKKKKKAKGKNKEGSTLAGKLSGAMSGLSEQQVQDLLAMNPSLAQELESQAGSPKGVAELLKKLDLGDIMTGMSSGGKNAKDMASYKFWKTQPVPKFGEGDDVPDGPLEDKTVEDVSKEPAPLLEGFEWVTMDLTDENEMQEVYKLLNGHYVEDSGAQFRFDYSTSLLKWALMAPGWKKEWHIGVRATQSRLLVAFISAIPVHVRVRDNVVLTSEVNFLVVHKKLRNKRLAPVMIKEVTRRSNLEGIWQGLYTGGVLLPRPVSTCRYYHRAINWQKLYDTGFSSLPGDSKPQYQVRKFAVPEKTSLRGWREMKAKDVDEVKALWERFSKRYELAPEFKREEFEHWNLNKAAAPEDQVIWSYVVEGENKKITDFISFYCLESSVIDKGVNIRAAYLSYYASETGLQEPFSKDALQTRLTALMNDLLVVAKAAKFDVFNALSLMDNALFLDKTKFKPGDGQLHYYMFNWRTKPIRGGLDKLGNLDGDKLSGIALIML